MSLNKKNFNINSKFLIIIAINKSVLIIKSPKYEENQVILLKLIELNLAIVVKHSVSEYVTQIIL